MTKIGVLCENPIDQTWSSFSNYKRSGSLCYSLVDTVSIPSDVPLTHPKDFPRPLGLTLPPPFPPHKVCLLRSQLSGSRHPKLPTNGTHRIGPSFRFTTCSLQRYPTRSLFLLSLPSPESALLSLELS